LLVLVLLLLLLVLVLLLLLVVVAMMVAGVVLCIAAIYSDPSPLLSCALLCVYRNPPSVSPTLRW
jgi:hypothetical protein